MDKRSQIKTVLAKKEDEGSRIDFLLSKRVDALSRSRIKKMCEDGFILVNKRKVKAKYIVREYDEIIVEIPCNTPLLSVTPEDITLDIIYEDTDIIVVNKPSGMVVHPSGNNREKTLVGALLFCCDDLSGIGGVERPGIVHRLDKDTSGVLVCAKNDRSHISLSNQFRERKIKKIYKAVVAGTVKEDNGQIDKNLGRHRNDRKKISVHTKRGKEACTKFTVVKRFGQSTLLDVQILTGRTHQIRVHLASVYHPVLGDPLYGGKGAKKTGVRINRLMLHADTIGFFHPATGNFMEFSAPIPDDIKKVIYLLEKG